MAVLHVADRAGHPSRALDLVLGVCLGQASVAQVQVVVWPVWERVKRRPTKWVIITALGVLSGVAAYWLGYKSGFL